nr:hypothetical protein [Tanacetum cinerariifolium]
YNCGYLLKRRKVLVVPGMPKNNLSRNVNALHAHVPSQQELDLLFGPLYDEFFNAGSNPKGTQPITNIQPTSAPSTPTYVHAKENNDNQAEEEHLPDDEFTNLFCAPTQKLLNHPLEQVRRNPSRPVQTRRQLATDPEMCMFALIVSTAELKHNKEAMADSAWIKATHKELHHFDRHQVWELVDKPFGKTVIRLNWSWKNKKDEDQTLAEFYSKHDPVKVVSLAGKTIQDAEMFEQLVDLRHLFQTLDVGVPPSDR